MRARVVFPLPGGPQSTIEGSRSASMLVLRALPLPIRCSWPTYSSKLRGTHASGQGRVLPQLSLGRDFEQVFALLCHKSPTPNPLSSHRDYRDAPTSLLKSRAPEGAYQLMSGNPLEDCTAYLPLTLTVHYTDLVQARQKSRIKVFVQLYQSFLHPHMPKVHLQGRRVHCPDQEGRATTHPALGVSFTPPHTFQAGSAAGEAPVGLSLSHGQGPKATRGPRPGPLSLRLSGQLPAQGERCEGPGAGCRRLCGL